LDFKVKMPGYKRPVLLVLKRLKDIQRHIRKVLPRTKNLSIKLVKKGEWENHHKHLSLVLPLSKKWLNNFAKGTI